MKQIQLTITAESPLAIGRRKPGGSVSEAEGYIPGTVIRGAIAAQILQQANPETDDLTEHGGDFQSLFLSEESAIFQNAYPCLTTINEKSIIQPNVQVLPATAVSSKTDPGFKPKGNGVFDTLIDRFCASAYGHLYDPNCPQDGRVEPYAGFYSRSGDAYFSHPVERKLLTRVGINRRRATAEEQVLYSIEVLTETQGKDKHPATYRSTILVQDDALAKLLEQYINQHSFRLGGSASRGLGKVKIQAGAEEAKHQVQERIVAFNDALKKRWQQWSIFGNPQTDAIKDRTFFTLNLQSDAILSENWQRTTVLSPNLLHELCEVDDPTLQLEVAYTSYDYRSGWNAAWGLMKDTELVTNSGGLYLFSTNSQELWLPVLKNLETRGIGDRTSEGFGQIRACDEFHLVFREDAV